MKILLASIDAKYTHSSLALRYLKGYCSPEFPDIQTEEFNINLDVGYIEREIYRRAPDILGIPCYIWNIGHVLAVTALIKTVMPRLRIILGGPEVSFDPGKVIAENPQIDFIVVGEGEETLKELLRALQCLHDGGEPDFGRIAGIAFRRDGLVHITGTRPPISDLDRIPSPYLTDLESLEGKIIYYESSRGCPFRCSYCLSSRDKSIRFFPLERVKEDLKKLIDLRPKEIRFVDRTFNCNKERFTEIVKFIISYPGESTYQFEIGADLFDDETLDLLSTAPKGLFRFEIGVQSTNGPTLKAVKRKADLARLFRAVERLRRDNRVVLYLDLIAGLPFESMDTFRKSFDDVFSRNPSMIQLGFLKVLKGSGIRDDVDSFGCRFSPNPPYEVLETSTMSHADLIHLHVMSELVDLYYNSHYFDVTIALITERHIPSGFDFFFEFAAFWAERGFHKVSHKTVSLYNHLREFAAGIIGKSKDAGDWKDGKNGNNCKDEKSELELLDHALRFDLLSREQLSDLPAWAQAEDAKGLRDLIYDIIDRRKDLGIDIKGIGDRSTKEILRRIRFERFPTEILRYAEGTISSYTDLRALTDGRWFDEDQTPAKGQPSAESQPTAEGQVSAGDLGLVIFNYHSRDPITKRADCIRLV